MSCFFSKDDFTRPRGPAHIFSTLNQAQRKTFQIGTRGLGHSRMSQRPILVHNDNYLKRPFSQPGFLLSLYSALPWGLARV